jgi:hypothetical protein
MSVTNSVLMRYEDEFKRRLQKLSRTYDLTTMKIFIVVECLGDSRVCSTYNPEKRGNWDAFLHLCANLSRGFNSENDFARIRGGIFLPRL